MRSHDPSLSTEELLKEIQKTDDAIQKFVNATIKYIEFVDKTNSSLYYSIQQETIKILEWAKENDLITYDDLECYRGKVEY